MSALGSNGAAANDGGTADTGAGSTPIVVNIVVKPQMEGTRLSTQSAAEIKQAAAAGANAALRAFYGR
jgi:hypothetical protein